MQLVEEDDATARDEGQRRLDLGDVGVGHRQVHERHLEFAYAAAPSLDALEAGGAA
jgi:hypothetical protein